MTLPTRDQFETDEEFATAVYNFGYESGKKHSKMQTEIVSFHLAIDRKEWLKQQAENVGKNISSYLRDMIEDEYIISKQNQIEY